MASSTNHPALANGKRLNQEEERRKAKGNRDIKEKGKCSAYLEKFLFVLWMGQKRFLRFGTRFLLALAKLPIDANNYFSLPASPIP